MAHEVLVIGCGGVGSAALYHLARRGVLVLGLEQHTIGHALGSSHGRTRIIRLAYFEHPDYVPLLRRAYDLWDSLAQEAGETLLTRTGLLEVGPPDGQVVPGVLRSAAEHTLAVDRFDVDEARAAFPAFRFEDGETAVFEHDAGHLRVEACVAAHVRLAEQHGAEVRTGVRVRGIGATPDGGVAVTTDQGAFTADRAIVTAGAWAGRLLGDIGVPLEVRRKHVYWFDGPEPVDATMPAFLFERPAGVFYGIPAVDDLGVKVAEHTGGAVVDPDRVDRSDDPVARERVAAFVRGRLPGVGPAINQHEVCLYTMTPDGHFVVDRHPTVDAVALAAGLSGHGFKFTAVLGEVLADLVTDRGSDLNCDFLGIRP